MPSNLVSSLFITPGPAVAVYLAPEQVTAVQIEARRQGAVVRGHARAALPEGVVTPAAHGPNVTDAPLVASVLDGLLEQLPRRPRRVGLLLPDGAAKVSMVRFAKVPARAADLDRMIRWQVRKAVPFSVDDAQMDWTSGRPTTGGQQEFMVVLAHRAVVEEYEQVCSTAGVHAGLVSLSSFSLIDAALASGAGDDDSDWLLVHVGAGSSTLAVLRGRHPLLFRTVAADGQSLGDLVHQTAMYYEDRLAGGGLSRALVAASGGFPDGADGIRRVIEDRLAIAVESIAGRLAPLMPKQDAVDPAALHGLAAPLGLLLSECGATGT